MSVMSKIKSGAGWLSSRTLMFISNLTLGLFVLVVTFSIIAVVLPQGVMHTQMYVIGTNAMAPAHVRGELAYTVKPSEGHEYEVGDVVVADTGKAVQIASITAVKQNKDGTYKLKISYPETATADMVKHGVKINNVTDGADGKKKIVTNMTSVWTPMDIVGDALVEEGATEQVSIEDAKSVSKKGNTTAIRNADNSTTVITGNGKQKNIPAGVEAGFTDDDGSVVVVDANSELVDDAQAPSAPSDTGSTQPTEAATSSDGYIGKFHPDADGVVNLYNGSYVQYNGIPGDITVVHPDASFEHLELAEDDMMQGEFDGYKVTIYPDGSVDQEAVGGGGEGGAKKKAGAYVEATGSVIGADFSFGDIFKDTQEVVNAVNEGMQQTTNGEGVSWQSVGKAAREIATGEYEKEDGPVYSAVIGDDSVIGTIAFGLPFIGFIVQSVLGIGTGPLISVLVLVLLLIFVPRIMLFAADYVSLSKADTMRLHDEREAKRIEKYEQGAEQRKKREQAQMYTLEDERRAEERERGILHRGDASGQQDEYGQYQGQAGYYPPQGYGPQGYYPPQGQPPYPPQGRTPYPQGQMPYPPQGQMPYPPQPPYRQQTPDGQEQEKEHKRPAPRRGTPQRHPGQAPKRPAPRRQDPRQPMPPARQSPVPPQQPMPPQQGTSDDASFDGTAFDPYAGQDGDEAFSADWLSPKAARKIDLDDLDV